MPPEAKKKVNKLDTLGCILTGILKVDLAEDLDPTITITWGNRGEDHILHIRPSTARDRGGTTKSQC